MKISSYINAIKRLNYINPQRPFLTKDLPLIINTESSILWDKNILHLLGMSNDYFLSLVYQHPSKIIRYNEETKKFHPSPVYAFQRKHFVYKYLNVSNHFFVKNDYIQYLITHLNNHILNLDLFGLSVSQKEEIVSIFFTYFYENEKLNIENSLIKDEFQLEREMYEKILSCNVPGYNKQKAIKALDKALKRNPIELSPEIKQQKEDIFERDIANRDMYAEKKIRFSVQCKLDRTVTNGIFKMIEYLSYLFNSIHGLPKESCYVWKTGAMCGYNNKYNHIHLNGMICNFANGALYKKHINLPWRNRCRLLNIIDENHPFSFIDCDCKPQILYQREPFIKSNSGIEVTVECVTPYGSHKIR